MATASDTGRDRNLFADFEEILAGEDSDGEWEQGQGSSDEEEGDIEGVISGGGDAIATDSGWSQGDPDRLPLHFTGQQGLQHDIPADASPLSFFQLLLPADFFTQLTVETNRYVSGCM